MLQEKRWEAIASSIRRDIRSGELRAGARIPSETEMASHWNVSSVTVHHALTELQREGWVVRRRKLGTIVADRSAQPTTKIALIASNDSEMPQTAYRRGIEESLPEGLQLVSMTTTSAPAEEAKCLKKAAEECSAIICNPTGAMENNALLQKIIATVPFLFIDSIPQDIEADVVMSDNFGSMFMGLQHLKSLGHTRIGYFMQDKGFISSVNDRYAAYQLFMKNECHATDTERWVRRFSGTLPWEQYYDRVEAVLVELLSEPNPITAIACQQDMGMATVLEACGHLGISVPQDLEVLSFNDMNPRMQPHSRSVNRLVQHPLELGHIAAKRIQLRLSSPDTPPRATRIMADLYPARQHVLSMAAQEFVSKRHSHKTP